MLLVRRLTLYTCNLNETGTLARFPDVKQGLVNGQERNHCSRFSIITACIQLLDDASPPVLIPQMNPVQIKFRETWQNSFHPITASPTIVLWREPGAHSFQRRPHYMGM